MKRFALGVLVAGLVVLSTGTMLNASYVSLEGQGTDRTGVVQTTAAALTSEQQDYKAEVMTLEGSVFVTPSKGERVAVSVGDTLSAGDVVEVREGGRVDIAFDKDWKNVTRFESGSNFTIKSVDPTVIDLPKGSVYARLKQLPKNSTFKVQTPTAIAAVRGSEYQVDVAEDGKTDISNLSESPVYVNGIDQKGVPSEVQTILKNAEFTQIIQPGARPVAPRPMTPVELKKANTKREGVLQRIDKLKDEGRVGKIQDVGMMNRIKEKQLEVLKEGGRENKEGAIRGSQGELFKKPADRELGKPYSDRPEGPEPSKATGDRVAGAQPQQATGPAERPSERKSQRSEKPKPRNGGSQNGPRNQEPPK